MRSVPGWLVTVLGAVLLLFGLACLNYTKVKGLEHRRAVAEQYGFWPPSPGIFYGGVGSVVAGSGLLGFVLGRRQQGRVRQTEVGADATRFGEERPVSR